MAKAQSKATKHRAQIGDTAWFVRWCVGLRFYDDDPEGDIWIDGCPHVTRRVASEAEAERLAKEVYPQTLDKLAGVDYWPAEFVPYDEDDAATYPHVGFWEATDDGKYYDGEE